MEIRINNKTLESYGIGVLEYQHAFGVAAERTNQRTWADKSGVDVLLSNRRYESRPFSLLLYTKAATIHEARDKANTLTTDMFSAGNFVLSLRTGTQRLALLCNRTEELGTTITVYQQKSLYVFRVYLQDVNPNALVYYNTVADLSTTILYEKGMNAVIYWGDGRRGEVSNSSNYTQTSYAENGMIDVIIDIDKDVPNVPVLQADFEADVVAGIKPMTVQFTDLSTGIPEIYNWSFGDGTGSIEPNPQHTYTKAGVYTVILQIFNTVNGSSSETKVGYITVRDARLMLSDTHFFKINDTDYLLKN